MHAVTFVLPSFFESYFVSVEKSLQKPGEMNEITQWSLYLTQLTDPIFFLLLIFVPVPFFHLTFIHLQFSFGFPASRGLSRQGKKLLAGKILGQ